MPLASDADGEVRRYAGGTLTVTALAPTVTVTETETVTVTVAATVTGCLRIIIGWVRFLVVCFLYNANPNPRKLICCGKK